MTRILFTTPFKPYGIDNHYSRADSFPECLHNRVTRAQGIFSYRHHFSAFGLHAIANNISADCTVLEYPTYKRFLRELGKSYDYVGIGSVMPNLQKVKIMAEDVRKHSPGTRIIVGAYCAHVDSISEMMPIDYLCTGDGISFMRELLCESPEFEFKNPDVYSRAHSVMGVPLFGKKNPHIIIGLGCPYGCDYCSPSHHFGRKYYRFYTNGADIFSEMERMEKKFRNIQFGFTGDDNFLLDLKRAEQLREAVVKSGKQYEIFYFASADRIKSFGADGMAEMGTNMVWIGRESCFDLDRKNEGMNLKEIVKDLHNHGIKVVISTMLLSEHHTPENIWNDVEDHFCIRPDFSMFTFMTALPGTPFYDRLKEEGKILWNHPHEEWNGMTAPNVFHPLFTQQDALEIRRKILEREYYELGPSVLRMIRAELTGYRYMKDSENPSLQQRAKHFASKMSNYRAVLYAMRKLVPSSEMKDMVEATLREVEKDFGRTTTWEKTEAMGLWLFGTKQKLRYRYMGDVIQPPTTVTSYPLVKQG